MTPKESRKKIYAFLHQKFGITRAENDAELQELKALLQEYGQAVGGVVREAVETQPVKKTEEKAAPEKESGFFAPKSFG